jgi:hypothetical protein
MTEVSRTRLTFSGSGFHCQECSQALAAANISPMVPGIVEFPKPSGGRPGQKQVDTKKSQPQTP